MMTSSLPMIYGLPYDMIYRGGHFIEIRDDERLAADRMSSLELNMIEHNDLPRQLPLFVEEIDFQARLLYDYSGMRRLSDQIRVSPPSMTQYYQVLYEIVCALDESDAYMLDEQHYVLSDSFIFTDQDYREVRLMYIPLKELDKPDIRNELCELALSMLEHVTAINGEGVQSLLRSLRQPNLAWAPFKQELEQRIEEATRTDADILPQDAEHASAAAAYSYSSQEAGGIGSTWTSEQRANNENQLYADNHAYADMHAKQANVGKWTYADMQSNGMSGRVNADMQSKGSSGRTNASMRSKGSSGRTNAGMRSKGSSGRANADMQLNGTSEQANKMPTAVSIDSPSMLVESTSVDAAHDRWTEANIRPDTMGWMESSEGHRVGSITLSSLIFAGAGLLIMSALLARIYIAFPGEGMMYIAIGGFLLVADAAFIYLMLQRHADESAHRQQSLQAEWSMGDERDSGTIGTDEWVDENRYYETLPEQTTLLRNPEATTLLTTIDDAVEDAHGNRESAAIHTEAEPMRAYLEAIAANDGDGISNDEMRTIEISGERMIIGRDHRQADIVLDKSGISRAHCELVLADDGYSLIDLGSSNGTRLNGEPVAAYRPYPLQEGDRIQLAGHEWTYRQL